MKTLVFIFIALFLSLTSGAVENPLKDDCFENNPLDYCTPGDFSDGTFGKWSLKRVPSPKGHSLNLQMTNWGLPMAYMELRPEDPKKSQGYRNELSDPMTLPPGSHVHYQFSTVFNYNSFPDSGTLVIAQWKEHDRESPGVSLRLLPGNKLALVIKYLEGNQKNKREIKTIDVQTSQIYDFDIIVKWPDKTHWGEVEFYINNKKITHYKGKIGSFSGTGHYFKYGMYNWVPNTKILSLFQGPYYRKWMN